MDSEIHYEGWLIKSPPTKRIWRARWRRRYFALKQGELPGQYLLEYYTDQTCRKLKGVIDLDQCEQVDAGLCMERKFPHVFNVKTPRRTYYLAADTDDAMRYWVNCICNVCGLQDLSKLPPEDAENIAGHPNESQPRVQPSYFNVTPFAAPSFATLDNVPAEERTYQNNDFAQQVLSEKFPGNNAAADSQRFNTIQPRHERNSTSSHFSTLPPASRRALDTVPTEDNSGASHDYYNDYNDVSQSTGAGRALSNSTAVARRRPENLKLADLTNNNDTSEPSPALSTSSGPYIPICECFSGSPVLPSMAAGGGVGPGGAYPSYENHFAPLNSLNNRFDIPKSPLNIGQLNLTEGPPPQSPRHTTVGRVTGIGGDSRSSDESESVFTDDDEASSNSGSHAGVGTAGAAGSLTEAQLRRLRPSDSSIENENIGWTAMQRYSKMPAEEKKCLNSSEPPPRPPKRVTDGAIGPLDSSSCVIEERYEIPRSHRNPEYGALETADPPTEEGNGPESAKPQQKRRSHFYTNAAPSNLEGQVFRYDFSEGGSESGAAPPPAINRNLKPKKVAGHVPSRSCDQIETPPPQMAITPRTSMFLGRQSLQMTPSRSDDKLQYLDLDHTNGPLPPTLASRPPELIHKHIGSASAHNIHAAAHVVGLPMAPPPLPAAMTSSIAIPPHTATIKHSISEHNTMNAVSGGGGGGGGSVGNSSSANASSSSSSGRGIVYKTVDFVKTEAFNRTRQDAEMNRACNKDK